MSASKVSGSSPSSCKNELLESTSFFSRGGKSVMVSRSLNSQLSTSRHVRCTVLRGRLNRALKPRYSSFSLGEPRQSPGAVS